ncbi:hypothetical protein GHT06_019206 [Daphnia sinensis]|uniref:Peptidase S1 domain-containing protein n=1 Tax=Daphnia sinensis TaxID=1820382 RepID=A0AAD5PSV7_9CRUS|nr:hypothetical protein GHT06_019206 [Daphnia sinensis]
MKLLARFKYEAMKNVKFCNKRCFFDPRIFWSRTVPTFADEIPDRVVRSAVYDNEETEAVYQYPPPDQPALPRQPSNTWLEGRSCLTIDGTLGTCGSIQDCYPNIRLHGSSVAAKWITNAQGSCSYSKTNGKQFYGLCCARQTTTTNTTLAISEIPVVDVDPITGLPVDTFPWWIDNPYPFIPLSTTTPNSTTTLAVSEIPVVDIDPNTGLPVDNFPWWEWEYKPFTYVPTTTPQPTTTTTNVLYSNLSSICGTDGVPNVPVDPLTGQPDITFPWWLCFPYWQQTTTTGPTTTTAMESPDLLVAILNNGKQFCGGSLIDPIHILTAAHCVAHLSSWDIPRLEVVLGMHVLKPSIDPEALRKKVKRVTRHRGFDSYTLYNDIAIITLMSPVTYGPTISPICLPTKMFSTTYAGKEAVVVGWGSLKEDGIQPNVLQQVTVRIKTNAQCKKDYGTDAPGGIANHMLCAGTAGKDACSGDSGGPLVMQAARGAPWVQAGIVSWGIGCGEAQYPGVYTRTASFMNWIRTNAKFGDEEVKRAFVIQPWSKLF